MYGKSYRLTVKLYRRRNRLCYQEVIVPTKTLTWIWIWSIPACAHHLQLYSPHQVACCKSEQFLPIRYSCYIVVAGTYIQLKGTILLYTLLAQTCIGVARVEKGENLQSRIRNVGLTVRHLKGQGTGFGWGGKCPLPHNMFRSNDIRNNDFHAARKHGDTTSETFTFTEHWPPLSPPPPQAQPQFCVGSRL